jgi:hypothetical protein
LQALEVEKRPAVRYSAAVTIQDLNRKFRALTESEKQTSFLAPPPKTGQLELAIGRELTRDRHADFGGRSFYFFDFDDNIAFLSTSTFIFHKQTGQELKLSSGEFAQVHRFVGKSGQYADYRIDLCDRTGTFRNFRDQDIGMVEKVIGRKQPFVQDLAAALGFPDVEWKGPSWSCFYHATLNKRPISVITARGHSPQTIREGIRLLVDQKFLPLEPNYLSIYPVTNLEVRKSLGDSAMTETVAGLKKAAIRASVERAVDIYGYSPYHRFGMSDDDPHNIELIVEEMKSLKTRYPEMSFFVIETQAGRFVKWEVYEDRAEATLCAKEQDLRVFEQLLLLPSP